MAHLFIKETKPPQTSPEKRLQQMLIDAPIELQGEQHDDIAPWAEKALRLLDEIMEAG